MSRHRRPIIPVYLNQRFVFDLLAMLQDGLSLVAQVTNRDATKDDIQREASAAFGVSNVLATLLKIDLSVNRQRSNETVGEQSRSEERVYTPSSLLFKLREMLIERDQLMVLPTEQEFGPGAIIEFATTLRRNPIVEVMDRMLAAYDMSQLFNAANQPEALPVKHKNRQMAKPQAQSSAETTMNQMKGFREMLFAGSTVDIVTVAGAAGRTFVLTAEQEFLSDPSMANLVEGQFTVMGKVIRDVPQGDSVNLLRKTAMGVLPEELLQQSFSFFDALSTVHGFDLPKAEWRVAGPATQVLPIAIYS
jgi:hypothetical protein